MIWREFCEKDRDTYPLYARESAFIRGEKKRKKDFDIWV